MGTHATTAAETLDRIRQGGANLVLVVNQRLAELSRALDAGKFDEAFAVSSSLHEKLGHLARCEITMGRLAEAHLVKCADIEPGMVIGEAGRIAETGPCDDCGREGCENIVITFESGAKVTVDRDEEMVVQE